ncbi:MAG TPA: CHASE2 domain-containing protein [Caulobacterales bacterium]|nr:CHASE2 domain-containing protein [Caulobacterales bacterium]
MDQGQAAVDHPAEPESAFRRALRRALVAFLVAIAVAFMVISLGVVAPTNPVTLWGLDLVMLLNSGRAPSEAPRVRFVFIDADDDSCQSWRAASNACERNSPFLRQKYQHALSVALQQHARAVLIDFELMRTTDAADGAFRRLVASSRTPIFAARPLMFMQTEHERYWRFQPTILDAVSNPNLHFGHVQYPTDFDDVIRRPLAGLTVFRDRPDESAPATSIAEAVAAFVDPRRAGASLADLECARPGALPTLPSEAQCSRTPPLQRDERFVFAVDPHPPFWRARMGDDPVVDGTTAFQTYSLAQITDATLPVDASVMQDAIVVLGSSRMQAADKHWTPIGLLPGAWIVVNDIHARLNYEPLTRHSPFKQFTEKATIAAAFTIALFFFWWAVLGVPRPKPPATRLYVKDRTPKALRWDAALPEAGHGLLLTLRWALDLALYALFLGLAATFIFIWFAREAGREMEEGFATEPFTPLLALALETVFEAVRALFNGIDKFADGLIDIVRGLFGKFVRPWLDVVLRWARQSSGKALKSVTGAFSSKPGR